MGQQDLKWSKHNEWGVAKHKSEVAAVGSVLVLSLIGCKFLLIFFLLIIECPNPSLSTRD